jgi:hypothetical protein
MYNKILKRPMFMRGGMGYSAQGTGITSGMDTPRPRYYGGGTIGGGTIMGNMMGNRTGFEEPELKSIPEQREDLSVQEQEIVKTPRGTDLYEIIGSFGAYANPKNPDGSYKTTGEMGFEQAEAISKIRKDRKDLQDAQKLKTIEDKRKVLETEDKFIKDKELVTLEKTLDKDLKISVEQAKGNNLDVIRRIKILDERLDAGKITQAQYDDMTNALLSKSDTMLEQVNNIAQAMIEAGLVSDEAEALAKALALVTGSKNILYKKQENKADGGRVGYQMGTSSTGAMPVATDTVMETETVTEEPQTGSVPLPYSEFRAKIPAEVSDEIVQLIYYNQNAFADFAQITTQADVYAFNNKYGVSLVLPMQTEMT